MTVQSGIIAFVIGTVVSLGASWILVSRLERVSERLGFSETILGLVAALAADAPEITASITALVRHERTIGAGVVIGSNVFNLAALLGLGAIVAGRIGLHRKVVVLGGAVALWISVICLFAVRGLISALVGLLLVLMIVVPYVCVLGGRLPKMHLEGPWMRWLVSAIDEEELELITAIRPTRGRPRDVFEAVFALVVVIAASIAMERGAASFGSHYHVADVLIGALVLAAVTSLPNVVAAVYLARKGRGAAALSTALNSNAFNVLVGLLLPASIVGMAATSGEGMLTAGWYVGLTVLILLFAYADRGLRRPTGWVIVIGYGVFVVLLVINS